MTSPINNNSNPISPNPATTTSSTTPVTPTTDTTKPVSGAQSSEPVEASKKGAGATQYVDPSLDVTTSSVQQQIIQNQILQAAQQAQQDSQASLRTKFRNLDQTNKI